MSESQIGLAKTASTQVLTPPIHTTPEAMGQESPAWQGIPMDIFKFMSVDFFDAGDKHLSELNTIYEYAKSKSNGRPGDMIQKIEELQIRLGEPPLGMSRLSQLYNWIEIRNQMSDMNKKQKAMERGTRNF